MYVFLPLVFVLLVLNLVHSMGQSDSFPSRRSYCSHFDRAVSTLLHDCTTPRKIRKSTEHQLIPVKSQHFLNPLSHKMCLVFQCNLKHMESGLRAICWISNIGLMCLWMSHDWFNTTSITQTSHPVNNANLNLTTVCSRSVNFRNIKLFIK